MKDSELKVLLDRIENTSFENGRLDSMNDAQRAHNFELKEENRRLQTEVETMKRQLMAYNLKPTEVESSSPTVDAHVIRALLMAFKHNEKIQAIKIVRELTWLGLKDSKDLVEQVYGSLVYDKAMLG